MSLRNLLSLLLFMAFGFNTLNSFAQQTSSNQNFQFRAVAELGFLGVLSNQIQFGKSGTYFAYQKEGGQDVLFPVSRLSLELDFKKRNRLIFLYQPLKLESQDLLANDLIVNDLVFKAGSNVKMLYNFPFYRLSYLRELLPNNEKFDFGNDHVFASVIECVTFVLLSFFEFFSFYDFNEVKVFNLFEWVFI